KGPPHQNQAFPMMSPQTHQTCMPTSTSDKMETACWVIHECPNYTGHQYFLKGQSILTASTGWVSMTPSHSYSSLRNDFRGSMLKFMENSPSFQEGFHFRDIQSCNILEESCVFYEQPHFQGQQYLLRPENAKVGSFQPTRVIF
uniref:Beta/gamma crystallin 'Greek key' domain-containing protein n=1 Tax=Malurus cyaneus samueli TaxID=2593467 RepID=A0A8C5TWX5_9PASS